MSEQEYIEQDRLIDEAILLSKKKILAEKALHGETLLVFDSNAGKVVGIPASVILDKHPEFRM